MIVDYLTEHGVMDATLLYESPFTDITVANHLLFFIIFEC